VPGENVSLIVKNFNGGDLGLTLTEAADPDAIEATKKGDLKPVDANPEMAGVQFS
jgi:hypothetical protein